MLRPISLVWWSANHLPFSAKELSSVVHTGVKSAGWLKRMVQWSLM